MLCAGLVHGDLSEFNVLVAGDGPVIIDLPQAIDAAGNNNAGRLFARDVDNLAAYFGQFAPELLATAYAEEIWHLYEKGELHPESALTGRFARQRENSRRPQRHARDRRFAQGSTGPRVRAQAGGVASG